MSEKYFQQALADFTTDFASGGAVRVMADKGYTVSEIGSKLDYPLSKPRIAEMVWKRYIETGVIRLTPPDQEEPEKCVRYEKVRDEYGKTSFRQVITEKKTPGQSGQAGYTACDFGKRIYQNNKDFAEALKKLSESDREYILDLPWPLNTVWHVKNDRMERIGKVMNAN